ncbi:MAG TPA: amidase [Candidatus Limnocylindria bacterium]|nr:amidase [Candidatus Limnocylindria bacterium]
MPTDDLRDLPSLAAAISQRRLLSRAAVEAALSRYDETEPRVHAFAWLDGERALRLADEADRTPARGPLHGVPIGVKDIVDTAGIPTENGSVLFRGRVPDRDAALVTNLVRSGAIVLGKTVTAELAFYGPGPTLNPHDAGRTPGGSSMGSAAGVAAGVLTAAVGTQTNGSIIRPAAYCGVVGYKPTHGTVPVEGVFPFAPTLDHPGAIATTVEGCAWLVAAMAGLPLWRLWAEASAETPRFAALRTSEWDAAEDAMRARFQADVDALAAAGGPIEWPAPPDGLDTGPDVLLTIMSYESAHTVAPHVARDPDAVTDVAREFFANASAVGEREYREALRERDRLIDAFERWVRPFDAVLTPPAFGEAPTPETTGSPRFCSRWSLLGAPAVTIPTGRGPHGLPLGLQLVGARGDDRRLLAAAAWAEARIAVR